MASITADAGFRRIDAIPRRTWTPEATAVAIDYYTRAFKKPHGKQTLRPVQAKALHEMIVAGGFFGPMAVGSGKSIVSFLAFLALGSKRGLLILPGALVSKARRDLQDLAVHWYLPEFLSIESYDKLSLVQYATKIESIAPDVIVCDECHRAKNRSAAVTKRLARYLQDHQECKFVGMSGTILSKDIEDFAHLAAWALRERSPVPYEVSTLSAWVQALDDAAIMSPHPGVLLNWTPPGTTGTLKAQARAGIRERITESPGIVISLDDDYTGALNIIGHELPITPQVQGYYRELRNAWVTPDGWEVFTPVDVWRHARELCLGLHYTWDPRPPKDWSEARKGWGAVAREHLGQSSLYDTEKQLKLALYNGDLKDKLGLAALERWAAIEPTFTPNVVPVWHDDSALKYCEQWAKKPGIIWTDHVLFARKLSERTGLSYYANRGLDPKGRYIMDHSPKECIIASVDANCTGRDLQAWHRNLITSPRSNHKVEQLLGRTHRAGQLKDEVTVDVLYGCRENILALHKAKAKSLEVEQVLGAKQKILRAYLDWPTVGELARMQGAQYKETESLSAEHILEILDKEDEDES